MFKIDTKNRKINLKLGKLGEFELIFKSRQNPIKDNTLIKKEVLSKEENKTTKNQFLMSILDLIPKDDRTYH